VVVDCTGWTAGTTVVEPVSVVSSSTTSPSGCRMRRVSCRTGAVSVVVVLLTTGGRTGGATGGSKTGAVVVVVSEVTVRVIGAGAQPESQAMPAIVIPINKPKRNACLVMICFRAGSTNA
jgi:hypothetical protein